MQVHRLGSCCQLWFTENTSNLHFSPTALSPAAQQQWSTGEMVKSHTGGEHAWPGAGRHQRTDLDSCPPRSWGEGHRVSTVQRHPDGPIRCAKWGRIVPLHLVKKFYSLSLQTPQINSILKVIYKVCLKLIACVCAKSFQSCPTLRDPVDCSLPGSSVHGILQARILEWVAMPSSRGYSWPRDWTWVSRIVGIFFTIWATREALETDCCCCCCC